MDPIAADHFHCDLDIAQKTVNVGVSAGPTQGTNTSWEKWSGFTNGLALDPLVEIVDDKTSILQVFAQRVCTGELAAYKNPIWDWLTKDYVWYVSQMFLGMRAPTHA